MSELHGSEMFRDPEAVVYQMQLSIVESVGRMMTHAWYDNYRNELGGARLTPPDNIPSDTPVTPGTETQIREMATAFTVFFGGISQAIKQHGYQFAMHDPETGVPTPLIGVGYNIPSDEEAGVRRYGYIARVVRPGGYVEDIPLAPEALTYQKYTPPGPQRPT